MPKRSAESLLTAPLPAVSTPRLSPPAHLKKNELAIWTQITNALPASWFTRDQTALLERYCVHAARARNLDSLIDQTDPISSAVLWDRLTRLAAMESRVVLGLARAMRLTPNSRLHAETARNHARAASNAGRGVEALFDEEE